MRVDTGGRSNLGDRNAAAGGSGETRFGGPGEGFGEGLWVVGRLAGWCSGGW